MISCFSRPSPRNANLPAASLFVSPTSSNGRSSSATAFPAGSSRRRATATVTPSRSAPRLRTSPSTRSSGGGESSITTKGEALNTARGSRIVARPVTLMSSRASVPRRPSTQKASSPSLWSSASSDPRASRRSPLPLRTARSRVTTRAVTDECAGTTTRTRRPHGALRHEASEAEAPPRALVANRTLPARATTIAPASPAGTKRQRVRTSSRSHSALLPDAPSQCGSPSTAGARTVRHSRARMCTGSDGCTQTTSSLAM